MSNAGQGDRVWLAERHFIVAPSRDEAEGEGLLRTVTRVLQDGGESLGTRAHALVGEAPPPSAQKVVRPHHLVVVR